MLSGKTGRSGPVPRSPGHPAQAAVRVEYPGRYVYQIQLGPTPEEGPNLLVETTEEMGGDYELNKAVMDRMMATIEFFGSTQ
jgi:hypothetical protein